MSESQVDTAKRLSETKGGYPAGNQDPNQRGLGNAAGYPER